MSNEVDHIGRLRPDPRNARRHNPRNVGLIVDALGEVGAARSIVIDEDDTILAGNATIEAAAQAGIERLQIVEADGETIVAVRRRGLTPEQKRRLALFDNRAAELAEWDESVIAGLVEDTDLSGLFSDDELAGILAVLDEPTTGLTDPDAAPEPPAEPITRPGDLWRLGLHRLLCGDSTVATDVERLMGDERAVLMATDPPYLVDYDGGRHPQSWSNKPGVKDKHWDDYKEVDAEQFYTDFIALALAAALVSNPAIYQWHAATRSHFVINAWNKNGLLLHQQVIWAKARAVLTHSHYMRQHEPCFYGWVQGKQPKRRPVSNATTVWQIDQAGDSDGIHPTQKPVELVTRSIEGHTISGDLIYEPFSGSGTAIIAAEQTGRRCYAMELSPEFVDVAVTRWQDFTGQTATRETA